MSEANATLKEAFRHQAWATRELLAFCERVSSDQLSQPRPLPLAGDLGSILETLQHIVGTDGAYLGALTGNPPAWAGSLDGSSDLGELRSHVDESEALWMEFLSLPDDATRKVLLDRGTYETRAAVVTAQALHHGSAHREQVCAILRDFGLDPPAVQMWDFADSTGRSHWIKSD